MLFYDNFYRRFGIRKADQMIKPPLPALNFLDLPKRSIVHYVGSSPLEAGPASDEFLFRNITKPIMVEHVTEAGDTKGQPRRIAIMPEPMIRTFHIKNRRYKQMRSLEASTRDDNSLVVYNYSLIPRLYRYMRSYYSEYYKWWNIQAAVWKNAGKVAMESDRNQFIVCKLPMVLPSMPDLRLGSQGINQKVVKIFHSAESLMILELWKWLGEERKDSVISFVPESKFDRINFIFQESGRWFVMNLGVLNQWRMATKAEKAEKLAENPDANVKGMEAGQIQRRFLRLMMSLFEVRTVEESAPVVGAAGTGTVVKQEPGLPAVNPTTGAVEIKTQVNQRDNPDDEDEHEEGPDDRAEDIVHDAELEQQIDADLAELETISQNVVSKSEPIPDTPVIIEPATLEDGVMKVCDRLADLGMLSAAEYRRYGALATSYRSIISPDGVNTLDKFVQIPAEDIKMEESPSIPDISTVVDKTMLKSSLLQFDERYIKKVLAKDVAGMVLSVQNAGVAVTNYEVERVDDVLGSYDIHAVRVTPVEGASSILRFKLPAMEDDGTYRANGVKYRMRKQRGDLPIRKIGPDVVALTSYYGKVFVSRSDKRVNDYGQWLRNIIMARGLDTADISVVNLHPTNVFDNTFECPRLYSILSMGFRDFVVADFFWSFDHGKREELFGKDVLKLYEKDGAIVVGEKYIGRGVHQANDPYLIMDKNSFLYKGVNGVLTDLGTIEDILGLEAEKAPVEFAQLKVLGQTIPIGVILGYEMGFEKLMKMLKVEPRRVPAGSRVQLDSHEYSVVFSDETLVFSRDDKHASIIMSGFNEYHKAIRSYSVYEFDNRGVYLNILESNGIGTRYLREVDLLYQMFIDPITRDLLVEMKEPTDFHGLLMRSCELLLTDLHPDELDPACMRIKGYERLAGAVYSELVKSIRIHNGRSGKSKQPIDLNPYAVWKTISKDPANALVSDINPIQNLKETEAVTYSGTGGRNSRSMTKHTRVYHKNEMGTISESTVDSSDVGINVYTSADPQFTSLRGISRRYKIGETGPTALLSTSALISPGADRDDPKRVNFIGIQHGHTVSCSGYTQSAVRTGYEQVLAHRTSDLFALTAKKPGKVISIDDEGIVVEYEDGETKGYEIGRRFGHAAGLVIPHSVVTDMKVGQKFKEGALICYNDGFFEKDLLNPNNVVWKSGTIVKTALFESTATLEDSSAISARVANLLTTKATKIKDVVVSFDQAVRKLVKAGDLVESENILCIIEDAVTANANLFDEESLDTLKLLSAQTPQAKVKGVVEHIEVYYHGEKEDMSESLRAIANASDREFIRRNKAAGKKPFTGSVDDGFRVDGEPLALDTMAIRIYITSDVSAGVGDKGVFCNQMKTVFGEVLAGDITTESGKQIDAIFGYKSISDRIVLSPEIIGTTTTLLDVIGKKALKAYRS